MTEYVITDGRRYLKQNINGRYLFVNDLSVADRFYVLDTASAILNNSLNYTQKKVSYIAVLDGDKVKPLKTYMKGINSVKPDMSSLKGYAISSHTKYLEKWYEAIEHIKWVVEQVENRSGQVDKDISKMDLMLEDLSHSYLYKNLNACEGFKRDKIIQRTERKRRDLKDERLLINAVREMNVDAFKKLIQTANNIKGKTYKARVLPDLFEGRLEDVYNEVDTY